MVEAGQITDRNNGLPRARGKARAEYLRRDSCVSGKECDGTLQEVDLHRSNKVVPQVNTLSLIEDRVYFLQRHFHQKASAEDAANAAGRRQRMKGEKMKKLLVILLALAMTVMMFTGCAKESGTAETDGDTYKIGIVQMMEHPSLNTIRESIIEGLAEEGFVDGENIEIIYQNGQNDMTTMQNIAQTFVGEEVDVIVAIATQAAQASLAETTDIPIVFAAITDPVGAGLVESLDAPGGNVTGTSDEISAADIMDLAQQITPGFKTIGALYNIGEDNSESVISDLKEYASANGFEVIESTVTNTSEVQQAAQYLADKADVVFSPIDNTVASSMALAADVFNEAGIPFYVSADSMVADGGLATYGIDYTVLGKETAGMVAEVLRGADPASMAVRKMSEMSIYINTDTAEALGIEIPQDILDQNKLEG